jgi:hypothetical protein
LIGATVTATPADAAVYDATTHPLKFVSSNRVAISPAGNVGKNLNDIVRYNGVTTIDGVVIDAVIKVVALDAGGTITTLDDGAAVSLNPPTSPQTVGDLLLTDIDTTATVGSSVVLEFSFYEGGTYTGVGSGIPVTLANAHVSAYDIDAASSVKQYVEFRGFQSYSLFSGAAPDGIVVSNQASGMVRFAANTTSSATAAAGSYSWARVQVNYDRTSILRVRLGALGANGAFHALDLSAGGIWTTNGTTEVFPTTSNNPNNSAPVTADVHLLNATINTQTVLATSDFPYTDVDDNFFAAVRIVTAPSASAATLEYFNGTAWVTVANGTVISTADINLGKLRLSPVAATGSFDFQVYDGLAYSTTETFSFDSPALGQTITFANPGTKAPSVSFASGATATSGLTPTLTSLTPAVCTVTGLNITTLALPSGVTTTTCVVTATQAGDGTYGRADAITQQFSVSSLLAQTITFANPGDQAFSVTPIASGAVASPSGLAVTLNSLTPSVCTVSGLNIVPVTQGLCSIRAAQAGNGTYAPASPVIQNFTLGLVAQTITYAQPSDHLINGGPLVVAPTASSGLTPVLSSSTPAVCTVSGFTLSFVGVGVCTTAANQAGDSTYAVATPVTRSFAINQVSQTITFAQPSAQLVNGAPLVIAPTASSGLAPVLSSSTTGVCTVSGFTVTYVSAGLCTISADQSGNASYTAAAPVVRSFAINLASQSISFTQPGDQLVNGAPLVVAPTATSGLTPVLTSSTTGVCTVSGMTISFVSVGVCTILANQAGDSTFDAAPIASRSFDVDQAPQTITFLPPADQFMDDVTLVLAPTASSGLTPVLSSSTTAVCTVSGLTVSFVSAGVCTIDANQTGDATYTAAPAVSRSFTIDQVDQTITFAQPADYLIADSSLTVAPTADSGLTPVLTSSTTGVCTVSGMTITFVSTGLCTVAANQTGDATYAAAAPVTRSFGIGFVSQTITFPQPLDVSLDDPSVLFTATTDAAGLTPALNSTTPTVCTVSGMTVTFVAPGLCTIVATQSGNATFAAAPPVSHSFQVVEIETDSLDAMRAGDPFTQQLSVLGAAGGGVWSTTTPLPAGLTLDPTTGVLTGTPTGPTSQLMTFAYTENGVVHDATLLLNITAALSPLAFTGTDALGPLTVAVLLLLLGGFGMTIAMLQRRRRLAR